ncbi:MAG: 23S rRNA (guanosine(2251)-2'-O)-methyltransferase RlmB [SAR324 cluster bacterium]|nr:23S rRNA (guanosine(2251)-2'-O)-methyltransferase RlmB [SAR324 cluster bacterium]
MPKKKKKQLKTRGELLFGIQPVFTALQQRKRQLDQLFIKQDTNSSERLSEILLLAEAINIPVSVVPVNTLTEMCPAAVHQGVVLHCGPLSFSSMQNLRKITETGYPLIIALDQIEDPHNLGAIIRSCGFFGVSAVVVPRDHSSSLTPVVSKASAGVAEWFPVVSVPNLARFLQEQKKNGYWVIGLDGASPDSLDDLSKDRPLILVLGNEGRGIRRLSRKHCDWLVRIPGNPDVSSLNVSNAAAVTLFHLQTPA